MRATSRAPAALSGGCTAMHSAYGRFTNARLLSEAMQDTKILTILVIEDDRALGPLTVDRLRANGHRAALAATADRAFQLLSEDHFFDAIVLDLQLGATNAEQLVVRLRALYVDLPPIVIVSGLDQHDLDDAARRIGVVGVCRKPCTHEELMAAIDVAMTV